MRHARGLKQQTALAVKKPPGTSTEDVASFNCWRLRDCNASATSPSASLAASASQQKECHITRCRETKVASGEQDPYAVNICFFTSLLSPYTRNTHVPAYIDVYISMREALTNCACCGIGDMVSQKLCSRALCISQLEAVQCRSLQEQCQVGSC